MGGNTLTAVEYLHRALGQPGLDLLADQGMRDGVEEPGGCDVIVDVSTPERKCISAPEQRCIDDERWEVPAGSGGLTGMA
jgi:hypothetical protein